MSALRKSSATLGVAPGRNAPHFVSPLPLISSPPPPPLSSPHLTAIISYDWRFSQPNGADLLVQSANWKGGDTVFTTQLVLEREPLTWSHLAFMLFVAFPFLTFRIQWWIHYEAVRLFLRGMELFPHPTGARNAFVNTVETLVAVVMGTVSFCKGGCCGGGRKGGAPSAPPPAAVEKKQKPRKL